MDNPENSALVTTIETLEALYGPIEIGRAHV